MAKGKFPILPVAIVTGLVVGGGVAIALASRPTEDNLVVSLKIESNRVTAPFRVLFEATAEGGIPPHSFAWDFGDGSALGSGSILDHEFVNEGVFKVQLTVMDSSGISKIKSVTITVDPFDPDEKPPIEPGDLDLVIIDQNPIFKAQLSNLRSDVDADGTVTWFLSKAGLILDQSTVSVLVPASQGASVQYGVPGNLESGVYQLQAVYQNKGFSLTIAEAIVQFEVVPDGCIDDCPTGQHKDENCNCVPDSSQCNEPCPIGQHRDANCNCVPDDTPGFEPKFGDATVTIDQLLETVFRTTIKNNVRDSWQATLTQEVFDSGSNNRVFTKTSNFTLSEFQEKLVSAFIPTLPPGNYRFESGVRHTPTGTLIGNKILSFVVDGGSQLKKMSMNWKRLDCFSFNPSSNFAYDVICGGTVELHNQGDVPITPILELFVDISAPGQNEVINLAISHNAGTIQPGQKKDVDFNLPLITMFTPAIVVNTLEVRDSTDEVLDSEVKKYTLRDDGVIVKQ